jgi:Membrane domain of glycerophosphoryl diester phosphodiesterase
MGRGDAIPGWGTGAVGGPDPDPGQRRIPEVLADVWRTFRERQRAVLQLAAATFGLAGLVFVPIEVDRFARFERLWSDLLTFPTPGPDAILPRFRSILGLDDPFVTLTTVLGSGLAFLGLVALTAALAALIASPRVEDRTIRGALGAVVRRAPALAVPAVIVALVAGAGVALEALWLGSLRELEPDGLGRLSAYGGDAGRFLLGYLLLAILIVGGVYCVVRWAVAIPALIVEGIGLRSALRRSSELTHRRRVSVALTLFAVVTITSFVSSFGLYLGAFVPGVVLGLDTVPGFATSGLLVLIVSVLLAPFGPLALVLLYRDLSTSEAPGPAPAR